MNRVVSGHAIRDGRAVCLEPPTALCRARWGEDCDCEVWYTIEQHADGSWSHRDPWGEGEHRSIDVWPADGCNICNWLQAWDIREAGPEETWADGLYLLDTLPDGAIEVEWDDDSYAWDYIEPRTIGRVIGLCAVAAWAEDHGYEVAS